MLLIVLSEMTSYWLVGRFIPTISDAENKFSDYFKLKNSLAYFE